MGLKIDGFDWGAGNREKCRKHEVSVFEVEALFDDGPTIFSADPFPSEKRIRAIGRTASGRGIFVVFTIRKIADKTHIRPISARYMHQKEIEYYEEENS